MEINFRVWYYSSLHSGKLLKVDVAIDGPRPIHEMYSDAVVKAGIGYPGIVVSVEMGVYEAKTISELDKLGDELLKVFFQ